MGAPVAPASASYFGRAGRAISYGELVGVAAAAGWATGAKSVDIDAVPDQKLTPFEVVTSRRRQELILEHLGRCRVPRRQSAVPRAAVTAAQTEG